jgi:hypothetical protein
MSTFDDLVRGARYAYGELTANYDDPVWRRKRLADRVVRPVHARWPGPGGVDVPAADWDVLVVLDGCRADLFEAAALDAAAGTAGPDGGAWGDHGAFPADPSPFDAYERVTSRGSATPEWLRANFAGGRFGDTVYVSANPYVARVCGDAFHEVRAVWESAFDAEAGTVRPEPVVEAAREADADHPDKRVVVHFMQPHYPFLGHPDLQFAGVDADQVLGERTAVDGEPHDPWEALALGRVDRRRVRRAYTDNFEAVLPGALELARDLTGKAVVTADHGNLLGERAWPVPVRMYGHPVGVRTPALVEVPWAVVDGERRAVRDDGVSVLDEGDAEAVDERLRRLGYRE